MLDQGVTYNTTMALVVGIIMILSVMFGRELAFNKQKNFSGWGFAFVMLGLFLAISGFSMMLTWPLKEVSGAFCCTVDNITFGEPSAFYGTLTFIIGLAIVISDRCKEDKNSHIISTLRPILYIGAIGGFGLILFGIAGLHFGMWRPPTIEPIARLLAGNLLEPLFVAFLYAGTGVGAILAPFALRNSCVAKFAGVFIWCLGVLWIMLAFTVFYSHVGFFPQPDGSYM